MTERYSQQPPMRSSVVTPCFRQLYKGTQGLVQPVVGRVPREERDYKTSC